MLVLAGCGRVADLATPPSPLPATVPVQGGGAVAEANARLGDVAEAQRAVEPGLDAALRTATDVDDLVARVRDGATVDAALDEAAAVQEQVAGDELTAVADELATLRVRLDVARDALAEAVAVLPAAAGWEAEWLDVQAAVLAAVDDRAGATAEVLEALRQHRAAATDVLAVVADVATRRDRYRDAGEVAGTIEVEADDALSALAAADERLAVAVADRAVATQALNAADAAAAEVFRRRPQGTFDGGTS